MIEEHTLLPQGTRRTGRALKPHSPSLRAAREDHHHLMFPVRKRSQGVRRVFIRHPRGRGVWKAVEAQHQETDTALQSPLTLAPDFPVAPRGPR